MTKRLGLLASILAVALIGGTSLVYSQPFVVPPSSVTIANPGGTAAAQVTATAGGALQVECVGGTCGGGAITANQGTPNTTANRWPVQITDGTDLALVTAAGAVVVDGSGVTQPVSVPVPLTSVVTGQQAVTAVATVLPTNAGRVVCVRVRESGTQNVFYGPSGVTTATGQELIPGEGICRPVDNSNRFFVIAAGAGSTVAFDVYN